MKYLVIEKFYPGKVKELYQRFEKKGRCLPAEVTFIDSWIDEHVQRCFQLMESTSIDPIYEWTKEWEDLASFEIIPVISSREALAKILEE